MKNLAWGLTILLLTSIAGPARTQDKPLPISLDDYVHMAFLKSLRSQSNEESFNSARYQWTAVKRDLTWPTVSASGENTTSFSDDDMGLETETDSLTGTLALNQPFLTGTNISVGSSWNTSETDSKTGSIETVSRSKDRPDLIASINQPLYVFVRNSKMRTKKQSQLSWENSQDQYMSEKLNIEFDAKSRYYNLLLNQESVKVEKQKFDSSKLVHEITKALVRAGKKAQVELLRADVRANTDFRRIKNIENNFNQDLNAAKDFVLIPSSTPVVLISHLTYVPFNLKLEILIAHAKENNPNLKIAKRQTELSSLALQQTKEGNRPEFDLDGRYARTMDRSNSALALDPYSWSVGVGMTWPFFDASQTQLQTKQSEISLRNTKRNMEQAERDLEVSIKNQYLEIKRTEDQIKTFAIQKESAQKSLNATRLQYKNGKTRLTDVFDAENQLREIDLEYLGLLVDFNTARDRLSVLIGSDINILNGKTNQ